MNVHYNLLLFFLLNYLHIIYISRFIYFILFMLPNLYSLLGFSYLFMLMIHVLLYNDNIDHKIF
jgi:hypothetical protein